ncbi:MAG: sialidase family protein [Planctomycetia bacterium]|nr:sialidase family protein [Planctomycetia bacterium]
MYGLLRELRRTGITSLCFVFILLTTAVSAQQSGDREQWREEYEARINSTLASRRAQKPNFAEDVKRTKPDFIVYIPQVEPEELGDCYNDHFQVFDGPQGVLFATTCQATCEGALDQHVTIFKSTDHGKTWSSAKVLAGPKTMHDQTPIASWGFAMVSNSGRIYVIFNQYQEGKVSTNRQHTGLMAGIYSDDLGETWSTPQFIPQPRTCNDSPDESIPPEWVVWQRPLRLGKEGTYLVGVTHYAAPEFHHLHRTVVEFMRFDNLDDDPEPKDLSVVWLSTGEQALEQGAYCEEPSIVALPDGRLFALLRTGSGAPYWSVSSDRGQTWSVPEVLLNHDGGEPFKHPLSPCPIYDFKGETAASGYYYAFVHNTFDPNNPSPWQNRGPLYLIAGSYQAGAKQPIWFGEPQLFIDRPSGNSFYASTTHVDGRAVVWYPDQKFYLLGRYIDESWFENAPALKLNKDE